MNIYIIKRTIYVTSTKTKIFIAADVVRRITVDGIQMRYMKRHERLIKKREDFSFF